MQILHDFWQKFQIPSIPGNFFGRLRRLKDLKFLFFEERANQWNQIGQFLKDHSD